MKTETIDAIAAAGGKTTIAGASMTGFGWLTSNEFLGLVGAAVAIGGLLVNWYYRRESNKRQAAEHEVRMQRLRKGLDTDVGGLCD